MVLLEPFKLRHCLEENLEVLLNAIHFNFLLHKLTLYCFTAFSHQVILQCQLGGALGTAGLGQGCCTGWDVLAGTWLWTFVLDTVFLDKTSTCMRGEPCVGAVGLHLCFCRTPLLGGHARHLFAPSFWEWPACDAATPTFRLRTAVRIMAAEPFTAGRNRGENSLWRTHLCCVWSEEGIRCQHTSVFVTVCGGRTRSSDFCMSPKSALWHLHLEGGPSKAEPQGPAFL